MKLKGRNATVCRKGDQLHCKTSKETNYTVKRVKTNRIILMHTHEAKLQKSNNC